MRARNRAVVLWGLVIAVGLAGLATQWADRAPDGIERAARAEGFAEDAHRHAFEDGPLAGYRVEGVEDSRTARALAGVVGVVVTLGLALGLFALLRRRPDSDPGSKGEAP